MGDRRAAALAMVIAAVLGTMTGVGFAPVGPAGAREASATDGQHRDGDVVRIEGTGLEGSRAVRARTTSTRAAPKTATFAVTYVGFPTNARTAVQAAVDLWSTLVTSSQTIRITATWKPLSGGTLGEAGPAGYQKNFAGAPATNTWYANALANALAGKDLSTDVDINAYFASTGVPWSYGTPTSSTYDLETVALHELGHGLGFISSTSVSGGLGRWGGSTGIPYAYDRYLQNSGGTALLSYANGSSALAGQLQSNAVVWGGTQAQTANGGTKPALYAPNPYEAGSSISHFAQGPIGGDERNSLMTPFIGMGEWLRDPGDVGLGVLRDVGWKTVGAQTVPSVPSGLVASAGDGKVYLSWSAPTSTGRQKLTRYVLYRYTGTSSTSDQSIYVSAPTTTLAYGDLVNGTSYRFAVAAVNATGTGARSGLTSGVAPLIVAPFSNVDALVKAQFTDFLGRSATASELSTWRSKANDGTRRTADIVAGIASLAASATPSARLTRLYSAYFKRLPDFGGYTYWVGKLRSGTSLAKASDTFAASSEFKRTYGSLTNKAFVTLVYQNVLGRSPDSGGASYWLGRLDRKVVSRGAMMTAFSESSENVRKKTSLVGSVLLRSGMQRRIPTTTELAGDVAELDGPGDLADLAASLMANSAYLARFGVTVPGGGNFVPLFGSGFGPVVADATGHYAYVSNTASDRIDVVDIPQRRVVAGITVGDQPMGLDLSADETRLYVANRGSGTVSEIDTAARTVLRSIALPTNQSLARVPLDVAYAAGGRLLIADQSSPRRAPVIRLTLATGETREVAGGFDELAACPGRTHVMIGAFDGVTFYDTATDSGLGKDAASHNRSIACGAGSAELGLAGGSGVYDTAVTRVGTVPAPNGNTTGPAAVDPTRAVGYRADVNNLATKVEVLDLDRGRVVQSIPLPETTGAIGNGQITTSGDGKVVLLVSTHGLAVLDAPAVIAVPTPKAATPGSPLVPMAGRVTDVELAPSGATAWATNVDLSQVEVFDVATRARLATIPVGNQPSALTFSPDGTKAYVVGPGSAFMTVIDVASRTVLRRVPVAAPGYTHQFPADIGVTSDGRLHIASESPYDNSGSIFRLDLATETYVAGSRIDGHPGGIIAVTRDRSKALLVTDPTVSTSRWYSASTHALDPTEVVGQAFTSMALDGTGARLFTGDHSFVHGDLAAEICFMSGGDQGTPALRGALQSDGLVAFRLVGTTVERDSMLDCQALGTTPTGDVASTVSGTWDRARPGAMAITNDGSTVAVATPNGLSIVHPAG
jgi:YVTN family beta-propeller protein